MSKCLTRRCITVPVNLQPLQTDFKVYNYCRWTSQRTGIISRTYLLLYGMELRYSLCHLKYIALSLTRTIYLNPSVEIQTCAFLRKSRTRPKEITKIYVLYVNRQLNGKEYRNIEFLPWRLVGTSATWCGRVWGWSWWTRSTVCPRCTSWSRRSSGSPVLVLCPCRRWRRGAERGMEPSRWRTPQPRPLEPDRIAHWHVD